MAKQNLVASNIDIGIDEEMQKKYSPKDLLSQTCQFDCIENYLKKKTWSIS